LDLELSDFTRRAGSMLVAHSATALTRGLEPGEKVLVRDRGQHWRATVRDVSFDLTDTHYRLELGAAVDADEAGLLLASPCTDPTSAVDTADVLDLLRRARALIAERYRADALPR
jgi:hypothetical protein